MLLQPDVIAICALLEGRIAQHEKAAERYKSLAWPADRIQEVVANEKQSALYYIGLLDRFQQSVSR